MRDFNCIYRGILRIAKIIMPNLVAHLNGDLDSNGYITGRASGAFGYATEPAVVTCTLADTFYPILGAFSIDPLQDFTGDDTPGKVIYDGEKELYFEVDWHCTAKANKNTTVIGVGIFKNGVVFEPSNMEHLLKVAGEPQSFSGTTVVKLSKGDSIQMSVKSDTDGDIITFNHFVASVARFFV